MKSLNAPASVIIVAIQVIAASLFFSGCSTLKNHSCNLDCEELGFNLYKVQDDLCQCRNWTDEEPFNLKEYENDLRGDLSKMESWGFKL